MMHLDGHRPARPRLTLEFHHEPFGGFHVYFRKHFEGVGVRQLQSMRSGTELDVAPRNRPAAQLFQFWSGTLPQLPVRGPTQQSWQRQTSVPTLSPWKAINPPPHDAPPVRHQHSVWRIKIRPQIQHTFSARIKAASFGIKVTSEILHLPIRRYEQHPLVAQLEEIWTLCRSRFRIGKLE